MICLEDPPSNELYRARRLSSKPLVRQAKLDASLEVKVLFWVRIAEQWHPPIPSVAVVKEVKTPNNWGKSERND